MIQNHEIDYKIYGEEMQYVEVELDPNESAIAEPGAFMMMDDGIQMETLFGDGSNQQSSFLGKLMNAGKRLLVGENLFMTAFTNTTGGIKNSIFGGEGLFFATLRGPGTVWIQTLPISRLAGRILQYATTSRREEGSVLGGIGNILDGDGWR